jgi:hypothetical protein
MKQILAQGFGAVKRFYLSGKAAVTPFAAKTIFGG